MSFWHGLHHFSNKNISLSITNDTNRLNTLKKIFNKLILCVVVIGPLMNVPQLLQIITTHSAAGVSFVSWASFAVISLIWFFYGILHNDKPIMFTNAALVILQSCIAISVLIYS